jgi:competence ComEA-like helix-hairpin-helix protein
MSQSTDIQPQRDPIQSGDRRYTILLICSITLTLVLLCKLYGNSTRLRMEPRPVSQLASQDGMLFLQYIQKAETNPAKEIGIISPDLTPFFFQPLPINFASVELLQTINGIGPKMAEEIVKVRDTKGSYASAADLRDVPGIGPKRIKQFQPQLSFATRP